MKIGEIWISKQTIEDEFCKILISDRRSSETWIVEVLECTRKWHDYFYMLVPAEDEGDLEDVITMRFVMRRSDIVDMFTKAH